MTGSGNSSQDSDQQRRRCRPKLARLGGALGVIALALALMPVPAQGLLGGTNTPAQGPSRLGTQGPPAVRLASMSVRLALRPYTSCWSTATMGMCYDGMPARPLPSLGATFRPITLAFARDGWRFQVSVTDDRGHRTRVDLVRTSPRHWRLAVGALPHGHYAADVFGRGPQGDVAAAFAFTLE